MNRYEHRYESTVGLTPRSRPIYPRITTPLSALESLKPQPPLNLRASVTYRSS
jgi:hypothetical protein